MAEGKRDNTAVNELIDLAQQRPIETDDALFAAPRRPTLPPPFRPRTTGAMPPPLPRHRAPAATRTDLMATAPRPAPAPVIAPPAPAVPPARIVSEHDAPTRPFDRIDADDLALEAEPSPPVVEVAPARVAPTVVAPVPLDRTPSVEAAFWAGSDGAVDVDLDDAPRPVRLRSRRYVPGRDEATQIARIPGRRPARTGLWIAAAFALGLGATALIAWPRGQGGVASTPPPPPAVSAPGALAAVPAPVAVAAPAVVEPAAVEPVAVEPAVAEPAVVEPAVVEPAVVAPAAVEAAAVAPAVVAPAVVEPAVVESPRTSRRSRVRAERTPAPRVAVAAPAKAGAAVLMLGSKPPCEIWIDGKRTGLSTPQRALKVSPGTHRIRLVNRQHKIDESFSVAARADAPVKAIKDYSAKIRR